jgi:phage gp46-like protein
MSDIALKLSGDIFDLAIKAGDLEGDEGLETAVAISLFTNRRVSDEELPELTTSKEGWWGDLFPDVPGDKIGSRLWTLKRSKRTTETLRRAEDYAREALQWLIDDGISSSVNAAAEFQDESGVGYWALLISITRPSGNTSKFQVLWDKQMLKRIS